jgi:hypothetical protein
MNELRVRLPAGDVSLEGLMHVSARGSQRAAVLCHPHPLYGGQMDNNVLNALVDALIGAGFDTLRFNFRGVGNSEGRHGDGLDELHDVVGAVEHLLDQSPATHLAVVGYSFGAAVGLKAGMMDERVHALVGVALPVDMMDCSFLSRSRKPKLLVSGDRDTFAPLAAFAELYGELPEPREMLLVKGADHFYLGHEPEVARATVEYLDRVLRPPEASAAE